MTNRPLRVFLCHSSNDKPAVRELYQKLRAEAWIQPWLDEEELYPGQDWNMEIEKAVEAADAIIVCLSKGSITKEGYVQRELRIVLDFADYKPEGTLYIIPVRLEECEPPRRLRPWQYADYFEGQRERGLQRLLVSLKRRADSLGLNVGILTPKEDPKLEQLIPQLPIEISTFTIKNIQFMRIPAGEFVMGIPRDQDVGYSNPQHIVDIENDYWISRYPITNELYNDYVVAENTYHPVRDWEKKKNHPVTDLSRDAVLEYCNWLDNSFRNEYPSGLILRLPTEAEWEKAARGTDGRLYPWGNEFDKTKCNAKDSEVEDTTPVGFYTSKGGDSPYGCADMAGNVWEYTHSLWKKYPYNVNDGREDPYLIDASYAFRGGSFRAIGLYRFCVTRANNFYGQLNQVGFRVALASRLPS